MRIKVIQAVRNSIRAKLISVYLLITGILFVTSIFNNTYVNQSIDKINRVYLTNVKTNELSETLESVQNYVYEYLNTRSSSALENYYRTEQEYRKLCESLNHMLVQNEKMMLERKISRMSETYLELSDETIKEKRGRNVEKYKMTYQETFRVYRYIHSYINNLNQMQFRENSYNYRILVGSMKYTEGISFLIMIVVDLTSLFLLSLILRNMMGPLAQLAASANEVAEGNFDTSFQIPSAKDEIGILAAAFQSMLNSIRHYIVQVRENMELEQKLMQDQLLMEANLKDAQLKYLQAQINPHFLFNSLNAGAQLAMLEDAEQTSLFVQKMADFFRYNLKKMEEDATLKEEIEAVDNYIYILNVRFAGDIEYEKKITDGIDFIKVPSMILQPLVENAVNHGIRMMVSKGRILMKMEWAGNQLLITIADNGVGMSQERIKEVMSGSLTGREQDGTSSGVGLKNVRNRLSLYYGRENLLQILSDGEGKGTTIQITIPVVMQE